jgi:hypothetical protein
MACTYCSSTVVIPENLRTPAPGAPANSPSIFSGVDMNAMVGYGAQWSEVVHLAQTGNKAAAVEKYKTLTGSDESAANYMVDNLGAYQAYEFTGASSVQQVYAPIINQSLQRADAVTKSVTNMTIWLTCGITAFVLLMIVITTVPVLIGVFASLWGVFR